MYDIPTSIVSGWNSMGQVFLTAVSICVGSLIALQAAANAKLGQSLAQPLWSALIALTVSATTILIILIGARAPAPTFAAISTAPLWSWFGGLAGATFVTAGILFVPKIGAANFLVATITGQLILAALIDHNGWLGVSTNSLDLKRAAGIGLVLLGAVIFAVGKNSVDPS